MSASSCLCKCLLLMFVEGLVYWPGSIHQPAVRLLFQRHLFGVSKFIWWQNPLLSRSNNDSNINRYVSPNQRASWDFIAFREKQNKLSVGCLFYCFFPTSVNCLSLWASLWPSESYNSAVFSSTAVRRSFFSFVTLADTSLGGSAISSGFIVFVTHVSAHTFCLCLPLVIESILRLNFPIFSPTVRPMRSLEDSFSF